MKRSKKTVLIGMAIVFAACMDGASDETLSEKLLTVNKGISRDSLIALLGPGRIFPKVPEDVPRVLKGYRVEQLQAQGGKYQILWFRETPGTVDEPVLRERDTPLALHADTVIGIGWREFAALNKQLGLGHPLATEDK